MNWFKQNIMWLSFLFLAIIIVIATLCYRNYSSKTVHVPFEFVKEIHKPTEDFDNSRWLTYQYVQNEERLMYSLVDYYKQRYPPQQGYDSVFVQHLGKELIFDKYDYLIVYQKQLKDLAYYPYWAKIDALSYLDEKELTPTFDTVITDKVYIYRIKKNNKYRAPGP